MYLKQHKVGEDNPKKGGEFFTLENGVHHSAFYNSEHGKWYEYEPIEHLIIGDALYPEEVFPDFWYSEVTERLYTEQDMNKCFGAGMIWQEGQDFNDNPGQDFIEFISQLNKDKDK